MGTLPHGSGGEQWRKEKLFFSVASENAQSPHSGFSDATLRTTKQWTQKKTQGANMLEWSTQGAPVPISSEMENLTSSLGLQ